MDKFVIGFIIVWFVLCSIYYGPMLWAKVKNWYQYNEAVDEVKAGKVPVNYDQVKSMVINANAADDATDLKVSKKDVDPTQLAVMRMNVARIRESGFIIGEQQRASDRPHESVIYVCQLNPFGHGTGEAIQWARGYCMGANILKPRPYMDAA